MDVTTVAGVVERVGVTASVCDGAINTALVGEKGGKGVGLDHLSDPESSLGKLNFLVYVYGLRREFFQHG